MAGVDWQIVVSLLIVGGAVFILLRACVRLFSGHSAGGCGSAGCSDCSADGADRKELVTLQTFNQHID